MKAFKFGQRVKNIVASDSNPHQYGFFVRTSGRLIELTDKKGSFWKVAKEALIADEQPSSPEERSS